MSQTTQTVQSDTNSDKSNSIESIPTTPTHYSAKETLLQFGFIPQTKISKTLQGSIYTGTHIGTNTTIIIKRTDICLSKNNVGKVNGNYVRVHENIIKEANILIKLQNSNPPNGFVYMYNFIQDTRNYFLIMKYGGVSFFEYVKHYHILLQTGKISINVWINHVKILFKQMIKYLNWLHYNNICHMDISLENVTIINSVFKDGKFINHGQVYFVDFGLAIDFTLNNNKYMCNKNIGKSRYKAPELYLNEIYDARKADVWSLGVCLFVMMGGVFPCDYATKNDYGYKYLINNKIKELLIANNKANYIDNDILNLLNKMLCVNTKRYYMADIQSNMNF